MPLKEGDFVLINYTVKVVENGSERVIDTTLESRAREAGIYDPKRVYKEMPVIVGRTNLLSPVETVLKELDVGEKKEVEVPPGEGFGEYREDLVIRVPIKRLRRMNVPIRVGVEVDFGGRRGRIVRVTERFAFIDFNHPLAGKKLKVEVEVVGRLDSIEDKAKYLAARILGIDPDKVLASAPDEGKIQIVLPVEVLGLNDLDALLAKLAADVSEYLEPRTLDVVIRIEYPRLDEKPESGEAGESQVEKVEETRQTGGQEGGGAQDAGKSGADSEQTPEETKEIRQGES